MDLPLIVITRGVEARGMKLLGPQSFMSARLTLDEFTAVERYQIIQMGTTNVNYIVSPYLLEECKVPCCTLPLGLLFGSNLEKKVQVRVAIA